MNLPRAVSRAFRRVREPRVERFIMLATYLLALMMGVSAWFNPPSSIEGTIGVALTSAWAILLMVCGGFGAAGVLPGLWWAERVATKAGMTGAAIYAAVVAYLHFDGPGNRLPQFGAIAIVVLVFIGRAYKVRGINYEPRPEKE
ncbi:hypothetical protein [Nocardioides nanhaiensis]|uniref:Uncharacterized protein n=1 Tax=Nocardioides nanhaiensis TaxID=1476871 RepID=A0ABP8W3R3_9ACTN